jgi:hypothetical protein
MKSGQRQLAVSPSFQCKRWIEHFGHLETAEPDEHDLSRACNAQSAQGPQHNGADADFLWRPQDQAGAGNPRVPKLQSLEAFIP